MRQLKVKCIIEIMEINGVEKDFEKKNISKITLERLFYKVKSWESRIYSKWR